LDECDISTANGDRQVRKKSKEGEGKRTRKRSGGQGDDLSGKNCGAAPRQYKGTEQATTRLRFYGF
jgi:hypothetical protein